MAGNSLGEFARRIKRRAASVVVNHNANVIRLATVIEQTVVVATPVDTGHARANWQVTISEETTTELDEVDKSGAGTIAKAVSVLSGRRDGQTIHVANNVPYIKRLNEGSSAQAPANFVQRAINAAIAAFRGTRVVK
jgi:hypothetical protein